MYYGLGVLLVLAVFLAANAVASLASAALAGPLLRAAGPAGSARRLRLALGLRLFPSLASCVLALGLFLPSYALFEPQRSGERPSLALVLLGAIALAALAAGFRRGLASWLATGRLVHSWMRTAERASLPGAPLPVFRIRDPFPVVCLAGNRRPRLLVAQQVLDVLSPQELAAAVAHEAGHWVARDNLKRLLFRSCPDILAFLPAARRLEQDWARSSELAADMRVAAGGAAVALDLSAALVKVARLAAPTSMPAAAAVSALHGGSDLGLRVRQLIAAASPAAPRHETTPGRPTVAWIAVALIAVCGLAAAPALLDAVHRLTEAAVRLLI